MKKLEWRNIYVTIRAATRKGQSRDINVSDGSTNVE